jgi:hypothetical protein
MDVATISALAATAAAIGAFSVAGVQLYVGHRQSEAALKAADAALMNAQSAGRHTVAEFRQSWMDKVIDALSARPGSVSIFPKFQPPRSMSAFRGKVDAFHAAQDVR